MAAVGRSGPSTGRSGHRHQHGRWPAATGEVTDVGHPRPGTARAFQLSAYPSLDSVLVGDGPAVLSAPGVELPQVARDVDNGSAFVDAWLLRACAVLGIKLVHSRPRRTARAAAYIRDSPGRGRG